MASFIVLGLGVSSSYASLPKDKTAHDMAGPSRVFAGGGFAWNQFKSRFEEGPSEKLKGNFWSAQGGFEWMEYDDVFFKAEASWRGGSIEGSADDDGEKDHAYSHDYGVKGRVGYMFEMDTFGVAPYTGIGYQGQTMSFREDSNGGTGPAFQSRMWYAPVGVYVHYGVNEEFSVGLFAEAQFTFANTIRETLYHPSASDPYYYDSLYSKGNSKVNFRFELPLTWNMTDRWDLQLTPYYQHSKMTAKEPLDLLDPSGNVLTSMQFHSVNNTDMGANLSLGVRF
jgi:hypothetical protein